MTNEKALTIIKMLRECENRKDNNECGTDWSACNKCELDLDGLDAYKKGLDRAIEALEKQIPKKLDRIWCPVCGKSDEGGNYCIECGQRLR